MLGETRLTYIETERIERMLGLSRCAYDVVVECASRELCEHDVSTQVACAQCTLFSVAEYVATNAVTATHAQQSLRHMLPAYRAIVSPNTLA